MGDIAVLAAWCYYLHSCWSGVSAALQVAGLEQGQFDRPACRLISRMSGNCSTASPLSLLEVESILTSQTLDQLTAHEE